MCHRCSIQVKRFDLVMEGFGAFCVPGTPGIV
jgi:hypothetical protein